MVEGNWTTGKVRRAARRPMFDPGCNIVSLVIIYLWENREKLVSYRITCLKLAPCRPEYSSKQPKRVLVPQFITMRTQTATCDSMYLCTQCTWLDSIGAQNSIWWGGLNHSLHMMWQDLSIFELSFEVFPPIVFFVICKLKSQSDPSRDKPRLRTAKHNAPRLHGWLQQRCVWRHTQLRTKPTRFS